MRIKTQPLTILALFLLLITLVSVARKAQASSVLGTAHRQSSTLVLDISRFRSIPLSHRELFRSQLSTLILGWVHYQRLGHSSGHFHGNDFPVILLGDEESLGLAKDLPHDIESALSDRYPATGKHLITLSPTVPQSSLDHHDADEDLGLIIVDFTDDEDSSIPELEFQIDETSTTYMWRGIEGYNWLSRSHVQLNLSKPGVPMEIRHGREHFTSPDVARTPEGFSSVFAMADETRILSAALSRGDHSAAKILEAVWQDPHTKGISPLVLMHFYYIAYWHNIYHVRGLAIDTAELAGRVIFEMKDLFQQALPHSRPTAHDAHQSHANDLLFLLEDSLENIDSFLADSETKSNDGLAANFLVKLLNEVFIPLRLQIDGEAEEKKLDEIISFIQSDSLTCQINLDPNAMTKAPANLLD